MATIDEILASKGEAGPLRDERGRFAPSEPPSDKPTISEGPKPEAASPPEKAAAPPAEPPAPQAAPEPGAPPAAPETGAEPEKPPMVRGLEAGIAAERTKRQEAERERDEFRQSLTQMQQQMLQMQQMLMRGAPPQPQQAPPGAPQGPSGTPDVDFWENPVGYLQRQLTELQQTQEGSVRTALFQQAEFMLQSRHEDYNEARDAFASLVAVNPQLKAEFQSKPPHEAVQFAYQSGKQALDAQREYWAKKLGITAAPSLAPAPAAPAPSQPDAPPRSLNTESSGPSATPSYQGPPPLQKVFRNKF